jgi:hypothetical protein
MPDGMFDGAAQGEIALGGLDFVGCRQSEPTSMLTRVEAVELIRPSIRGRTLPMLVGCEGPTGDGLEVVAKFSSGCDQAEVNLVREVIGACLAADLGLPVPEPYLVDISPEWVASIQDAALRARIAVSSPVAFGSRLVTGQFATWASANNLSSALRPLATSVFAFDAIVQNPDRRPENANCIAKDDDIRIFDHELAFAHKLILFWKPPWAVGGLGNFEKRETHIFVDQLRKTPIDWEPIRDAWSSLSDAMLGDYEAAIPLEWAAAASHAADAVELIKNARDNIDGCLTELQRVLT